jgi:ribonuclease PH
MASPRPDGRRPDELRPVRILTGVQKDPAGSVQIELGQTKVLCAASIADGVPGWMKGKGRGWLTAEYAMLPGAVPNRGSRAPGGRGTEIQRLIGRALRAAVDLEALGERTLTLDCDVLQADAGTRVASITGGWLAARLAFGKLVHENQLARTPLTRQLVAVSCALVDGQAVLDPCYDEDHRAQVDANFVLDGQGRLVEVQATAEGEPFERAQLDAMLELAVQGARRLLEAQQAALDAAQGQK